MKIGIVYYIIGKDKQKAYVYRSNFLSIYSHYHSDFCLVNLNVVMYYCIAQKYKEGTILWQAKF